MRRWFGPLLLGLILALVGWQATLIAIPRVVMAIAVDRIGKSTAMNRMTPTPLATAERRTIVRPSPDLAYSSCSFDLSGGPLVVTVPPMPANYWSLSVFDQNTDVAFVRNNRDSGGGPIRVALALERQPVPAGLAVARVPGPRGIALLRILVDDRTAFPAIDRARRGATCGLLGQGR